MVGWVIGYAVAGAVVVVVAVVVLALVAQARRVADQVDGIVAALELARDRSAGLWLLETTNATAERVVAAAAEARSLLAPGGQPRG